jgi:hypothetical protein
LTVGVKATSLEYWAALTMLISGHDALCTRIK